MTAQAQDRTCYDRIRTQGIEDYNNGKYEDAIQKWKAAKGCSDVPGNNDLDSWIRKANEKKQRLPDVPEMVLVEGGTFFMGCRDGRDSNCDDDEKPPHAVTVQDFYIGKYEVTVAQFKAFVDATAYQTDADKNGNSRIWTGSSWETKEGVNWLCNEKGDIRPRSEYDHPVIHVSWNDAVAYTKWLAGKTGKKYRLPTEAEWEYAARGGDNRNGYAYAGSNDLDKVGWYKDNSGGKTHPVGQKQANELDIHDMSGNVWEWVQDCWHASYAGAPTDGSAWTSGECTYRVLRGGSLLNSHYGCRVANRFRGVPSVRYDDDGFRIAQDR
jgi:formylglycine-generating enzyme required for sulfatase activity